MRAGADVAHDLRPTHEHAVVSARAIVADNDVAHFVRDTLRAIRSQLRERHEVPSGPPFVLRRPVDSDSLLVEAGWPVDRRPRATGEAHAGMLPTTMALRLPDVDHAVRRARRDPTTVSRKP